MTKNTWRPHHFATLDGTRRLRERENGSRACVTGVTCVRDGKLLQPQSSDIAVLRPMRRA